MPRCTSRASIRSFMRGTVEGVYTKHLTKRCEATFPVRVKIVPDAPFSYPKESDYRHRNDQAKRPSSIDNSSSAEPPSATLRPITDKLPEVLKSASDNT